MTAEKSNREWALFYARHNDLARAQVYATLALAEAMREQARAVKSLPVPMAFEP